MLSQNGTDTSQELPPSEDTEEKKGEIAIKADNLTMTFSEHEKLLYAVDGALKISGSYPPQWQEQLAGVVKVTIDNTPTDCELSGEMERIQMTTTQSFPENPSKAKTENRLALFGSLTLTPWDESDGNPLRYAVRCEGLTPEMDEDGLSGTISANGEPLYFGKAGATKNDVIKAEKPDSPGGLKLSGSLTVIPEIESEPNLNRRKPPPPFLSYAAICVT